MADGSPPPPLLRRAEELHFSRAAARLNLAQSALSSQIRGLEREVEGPLLVRSTRRVELTPAGVTLFADAREILASVDEAFDRVGALARGESGSMINGSLGPAPRRHPARAAGALQQPAPGSAGRGAGVRFTDTVDGLRQSHADCALLYLPLNDPELEVTPLLTEQRVVVLPATHRLAPRKTL
jgi:DNA-binding transcriptional LysR family regulator